MIRIVLVIIGIAFCILSSLTAPASAVQAPMSCASPLSVVTSAGDVNDQAMTPMTITTYLPDSGLLSTRTSVLQVTADQASWSMNQITPPITGTSSP